jgi:hypothetical protein
VQLPISGPDEFALSSIGMTDSVAEAVTDTAPAQAAGPLTDEDFDDDIGGAAPSVTAAELGVWRRSDYLLTVKEALNLQFAVGAAAVTGKQVVLVHEASRSTTVNEGGKDVQYGVALRQVLRITQFETKASMALPVLAAQVEMAMLEASAFIEVRGYRSKAAAKYLVGTPAKFDVKGFGEYAARINKLEQLVLSDEAGIHPVRLTVAEPEDQDWLKTIGQGWGLARLAEGKSAIKAIAEAPSQDPLFLAGIQSVFDELNAGRLNSDTPTADAVQKSRTLIGDVTIKRKRFLGIFG